MSHAYLQAIESMVLEMEAMRVSARSHESDMHDHFLPIRAAADSLPVAGAKAD
jgi:hypothetical protein